MKKAVSLMVGGSYQKHVQFENTSRISGCQPKFIQAGKGEIEKRPTDSKFRAKPRRRMVKVE